MQPLGVSRRSATGSTAQSPRHPCLECLLEPEQPRVFPSQLRSAAELGDVLRRLAKSALRAERLISLQGRTEDRPRTERRPPSPVPFESPLPELQNHSQ